MLLLSLWGNTSLCASVPSPFVLSQAKNCSRFVFFSTACLSPCSQYLVADWLFLIVWKDFVITEGDFLPLSALFSKDF